MAQSALIKPAQSVIDQNRTAQGRVSTLRFPKDIGAHAMVLNFKEYEYAGGQIVNTIVGNSVVLPLPKNIVDNYIVQVDGVNLGLTGALAVDAVNRLGSGAGIGDITGDVTGRLNAAATSIASDPLAATNFFVSSGALAAVGGAFGGAAGLLAGALAGNEIGNALSTISGTALNPHTTVMFQGIGLKVHDFNWTLSPKSSSESEVLQKIVTEFRKAALPSYSAPLGQTGTALDRAMLKYPKMVDIFFVGLDQEYFFYYKTCMIRQMQIDYSGHGGNSFFASENGARPVMLNLSINVVESSIHTRTDYEETGA